MGDPSDSAASTATAAIGLDWVDALPHRVGDTLAVDVAKVDQNRQRIGPRRDVSGRLARLDHERGAAGVGAGGNRFELDRRQRPGSCRGARALRQYGSHHERENEGKAPGRNHCFPSSIERNSLRTSRCFTSDSGSLTGCTMTSPSGTTALIVPSSSLSP